mmetsp:Transcript_10566/g.29839  ORF Transcript_10566/g.29839 Transcript_10566/m.29839 type:complete len:232 (-) Transcript_10566:951-1646(-)
MPEHFESPAWSQPRVAHLLHQVQTMPRQQRTQSLSQPPSATQRVAVGVRQKTLPVLRMMRQRKAMPLLNLVPPPLEKVKQAATRRKREIPGPHRPPASSLLQLHQRGKLAANPSAPSDSRHSSSPSSIKSSSTKACHQMRRARWPFDPRTRRFGSLSLAKRRTDRLWPGRRSQRAAPRHQPTRASLRSKSFGSFRQSVMPLVRRPPRPLSKPERLSKPRSGRKRSLKSSKC